VAWFVLHLLDFIDDKEAENIAYKALKGSLECGWDDEYRGLYYFMDIENKPTLQLESSMKLWWPHTESMYALILAYTKTGDKIWLDWLDRVHQYTYTHFVDSKIGGWFGYCDRQGNLTHTSKGGNYKGFFHTPRALWQCYSKLKEISEKTKKDDKNKY
jgi:N-acylglucosamine 2-epimerase